MNTNNTDLCVDMANNATVVENKKRQNVLYIRYDNFYNYEYFYNELSTVIDVENRLSILVRVSYVKKPEGLFTQWKCLGEQISLFTNTKDSLVVEIKELHKTVNNRLKNSMEIYKYDDYEILGIQILIYKVGSHNVGINDIKFSKSKLGEHKDLVNVSKISEGFNKFLSLSNKRYFGVLLQKNIVDNYINFITFTDGSIINFKQLINKYLDNKRKIVNISSSVDFYQKKLDDGYIIITVESKLEDGSNKRYINIYNINGMLIQNMIDEDLNYNSFTRKISNVKLYINNNKGIYKRDISIDFPHVYTHKYKGKLNKMIHPDTRIGTMDLETYKINEKVKTYALGFYTDNSLHTFYVGGDLNSDDIIINCLDAMLTEKHNGYTFYIHNFAEYDSYFILPVVLKLVELYSDTYDYDPFFRDNSLISLKIYKKVKSKTYSIKIVDSLNFLQSSLEQLCKTFKTDVQKTYFPYDFVNKNTMFYIGNKPDIKYYNNIDIGIYNKINKKNWSLREETLLYLKNDLISLYEVMNQFIRSTYINFHAHVTRSLTISGLTMDIYLRSYHENNIPLIKQMSIYNNIKKSYYGGITEVYKPYGKNLYYYDVNSLYPYSALNTMPGLNCVYTDNINMDISELIEDLFGFYYCEVITSDKYIGLLPYRDDEGLIMPLGTIKGWYFSEELKFAYMHGYKVHIISGYKFNKCENVFTKYISELYKIKSTSKDSVLTSIAKSKLNNLLGRFGLDISKYITEIVSMDELINILRTKRIRGFSFIDDKIIVTHDKDISIDICEKNGIDYTELLENMFKSKKKIAFEVEDFHDVSIAISSAVTSYSRIFMNKIKLDILNKGGKIFYTDTDSIITDIKLDDNLVGNDIGQFKLEHEIAEGYFISNKTYAFKKYNDDVVLKNKGVYTKSLKYTDYIDLYLEKDVIGIRYESVKDYNKGVALFQPKNILLSGNSYTKRIKVFDSNEFWVDTKPIFFKANSQIRYNY